MSTSLDYARYFYEVEPSIGIENSIYNYQKTNIFTKYVKKKNIFIPKNIKIICRVKLVPV